MAIEITQRPTDQLIPYARNARTHSAAQVAQIAGSIKEFGFVNPVLLREDATIIAGHGRVLAAQLLGLEEVPCITLSHLTETQARAYTLADNRLALNAGWDEEMLALELADLRALDIEPEPLGFDADELDALYAELGGDSDEQQKKRLEERFMLAPFSVLSAREGWWQNRKRAWLALGIKSELGRGALTRGDNCAAPGGSARPACDYSRKQRGTGSGRAIA